VFVVLLLKSKNKELGAQDNTTRKGCDLMLTEGQCMIIEKALTEAVEPRKIAAYLCLHMGLTVAEATALRLRDFDFETGTLTIRNTLARTDHEVSGKYEIISENNKRELPMPPHAVRLLKEHLDLYSDTDCFIINGERAVSGAHLLQNLLFSINKKYTIADSLTAIKLRNAFIRRCIESDIDLYTIGSYIGVKQIGEIQKTFAAYLIPRPEKINALKKYRAGYKPPEQPIAAKAKRMNLLILGAGSQGPVVKETAEAIGVFHNIAYLDDDLNNKLAIDTCGNYKQYVDLYPIAIPSFGNCELRAKWINRLEKAGLHLPTLIPPMATVSPSAVVEEGTIVEMKAIVGTNARIKRGCIISTGAVVDLNATVSENCHIGSSATVKKDAVVLSLTVVPSGEIVG
jgi:acetyltransferase-like isoleucine patch superfamily enzyme